MISHVSTADLPAHRNKKAKNPSSAPPAPAPPLTAPEQTPNPSLNDMRIFYAADTNTAKFSLSKLRREQPNPQDWIDALLAALNIPSDRAALLKNQHMNYNKLNDSNILNSGSHNTFGYKQETREATIQEFILEQLAVIHQRASRIPDEHTFLLQLGAVLNGISRMLAHWLGDPGASEQILGKLTERLSPIPEASPGRTIPKRAGSLDWGNPVLMYLHDELNSQDAAAVLLRLSNTLEMEREDLFGLMETQTLIQLTAMKNLEQSGKNVHAARTKKLSIDDAAGLYSEVFLDQSLTRAENHAHTDAVPAEEHWSDAAAAKLQKLRALFLNPTQDSRPGKYQGNPPAIIKARRHEAKSFEQAAAQPGDAAGRQPEGAAPQPVADLRQKAIAGIAACCRGIDPDLNPDEAFCDGLLHTISNRIREAPVCITRFASDLLSRELAPQNRTPLERTMKPGTPVSYISLEELLTTDREIRFHRPRPGEPPEIAAGYTQPRAQRRDDRDISYTALLSAESPEGAERGISYPIFRSNKNRLFAGKQPDAQPAVFGTPCLLGAQNYHGLNQGLRAGTYGDVVLVFRKNRFQNCMYTFSDRLRGYTDPEAFVLNAFASLYNINHLLAELLVPGADAFGYLVRLGQALVRLALGQTGSNDDLEQLEVQIFDPISLSRDCISQVFFAQSVPDVQREQIKAAILDSQAPAAQGGQQTPDTSFYQYMKNELHMTSNSPTAHLYRKTNSASVRPKITFHQIFELLEDPLWETTLKTNFGFHSRHTGKPRTKEEAENFRKILAWFRKLREYKEAHPDMTEQELESFVNTASLPQSI